MKRIVVVCPNPNDATSYYRGMGPLLSLAKDNKVDIIFGDNNWTTLRSADLIFFQRPGGDANFDMLKLAKSMGIPVWSDYDDLLTAVPDSNPSRHLYWKPEIQRTMWAFLEHSDYLTTSTQYLADCLGQLRPDKKTIVIPNALDDMCKVPKIEAKSPGIVWRGSQTHDEDLYWYRDAMIRLDAYLKPAWRFIGDPFWLVTRELTEPAVHPWNGLYEYFHTLNQVAGTVMMVPLVEHSFNRAKSNIAWIEATRAGMLTVAPAWDEWTKPGIQTYSTEEEFHSQILHNYNNLDYVKKQNALSWEYIQDNLRLSKINEKRLEIIESI